MCNNYYLGEQDIPASGLSIAHGNVFAEPCPHQELNPGSIHFYIPETAPLVLSDGRHYFSVKPDEWNIIHGFRNWSFSYVTVKSFDPAASKRKLSPYLRYEDESSILLDELFTDAYLGGAFAKAPYYDPALIKEAHDLHTAHRRKYIQLRHQMIQLNEDFKKLDKDFNTKVSNAGIPDLKVYHPETKLKLGR